MSRVDSTVNYKLEAQDAGASAAFARLSKEMERTAAKAAILKDQAGFAGNELNKFAQVGGIALLGRSLAVASEQAVKLGEAWEAGNIELREMVLEGLKLIPIVGEFAKVGENIGKFWNAEAFAAAARELANANADTKNIETRGRAIDNLQSTLKTARNQADAANLAVGGDDKQKAELAARQQFQANMETVKAREKELRGAGIIDGKQFDDLKVLERYYRDVYDAALLAATLADNKARAKQEEEIRKRDAEMVQKRNDQIDKFQTLQQKFFEEDRLAGLNTQRDVLQKQIAELERSKPSIGATAQAQTDFGASALIAARSQRTADPGVEVLKKSQLTLANIDKTLKNIERDNKVRERVEQVQSIFAN